MLDSANPMDAPTEPTEPLRVEFLYSDGCPGQKETLQLLTEVLQVEEVFVDVQVRQIETDDEAREMNFPGSPTIRMNGEDIDPMGPPSVGLSCRVYTTAGGTSPVPPRAMIEQAIRRAGRADSSGGIDPERSPAT